MKREKLIFLLIFVISLIAYVFTDIAFAAPILMGMSIYAIFALLLIFIQGHGLKVAIEGIRKAQKGEHIRHDIICTNEGLFPIISGKIIIEIENRLTGEKEVINETISIFSKQKIVIGFETFSKYCGAINVKIKEAIVHDPLMLFQKKVYFNVADFDFFVMPNIHELHLDKEDFDKYDMESFKYSETMRGDDLSETFGIKEYGIGDSIKSIHWKLSGKLGKVMVRIPSLPIENSLMIIMDNRLENALKYEMNEEDRTINSKKIDSTIERFIALSNTLCHEGMVHFIGWYDKRQRDFKSIKIISEEDIYKVIPDLISSPFYRDNMNPIDMFLEADVQHDFASYIYVTDREDDFDEIERLREYGDVKLYGPSELENK